MPDIFHLLKKHASGLDKRLSLSETKRIYNISIPHLALFLSFYKKPFIAIEDSEDAALKFYHDLLFFNSAIGAKLSAIYFPPPSSPEHIGERAKALRQIQQSAANSRQAIITSKDACQTGFNIEEIEGSISALEK